MNILMQRHLHFVVALTLFIRLASANENESCTNISTFSGQNYYHLDMYPYYYNPYDQWTIWYNTTFWGGYHLIAWQDQIPSHCWNRYTTDYFLVLSEKHPQKLELSETPQSLQGHLLSQTGVLEGNVTVQVRKCNGDVLYKAGQFLWNAYICFDMIYKHTCDTKPLSLPVYTVGNSISVIKLKWSEIKLGWYDTSFGEQNYTLPQLTDMDNVNQRCFDSRSDRGLYVQAVEPMEFGESPVGLRVCLINSYEYEYNYKDNDGIWYWYSCDYHVFVRSCNGKLIFDLALLAYLEVDTCLIRTDNLKVVPEIHHSVQTYNYNNKIYNQYNPSLQYRCSFQMKENYIYEVKWFINGEFLVKKGPTKDVDELVLTEFDLNSRPLGYEVKCSIKIPQNESDIGDLEVDSETYFAGYEFSDKDITISTQRSTSVTVRKTVPTGCSYNDLSPGICQEPLTLIDRSTINDRSKRSVETQQDICSYGVNSLNADDHTTFDHNVKTLRAGETWTGTEWYRFDLETRDDTYQDSNLRVVQVNQNLLGIVSDNTENELQMTVTDTDINVNKVCYSHVDPHMRTADGRIYNQQREGDYMLYINRHTKVQVQERARKCFHQKYKNAVCACAVSIKAGRDLFTINRCEKPYKIKFEQCQDCGNLDVVKKSDYLYEVFAPITSTRISIDLLKGFGSERNMNIDIYLQPKDFRNTAGLCGYFDGDNTNDFISGEGKQLSGNGDYKFSESWRLERLPQFKNLFENPNAVLDTLKTATTKCFRPNSITIAKCQEINPDCSDNRKKRANDGKHLEMIQRTLGDQEMFRSKRDTETDVTRSEAEAICRNTVMSTPAVLEFPDKLADEDLDNVIEQCIYDVTQTNDASWAEAHKQALNNLAITILNLNPIYKANNTGLVEAFLKQTCVNNCGNNGVCTNKDIVNSDWSDFSDTCSVKQRKINVGNLSLYQQTGRCSCNEKYRGFDCGVDVRIPPLIEGVTDSGICDTAEDTDCRCFVIHTNNIFEGFRCEITTLRMSFNGSRYALGSSNTSGKYSDIFTGECCARIERTRRSDVEEGNFIHSYDIAISNDGEHFSSISSVYVYDATCLLILSNGELNTIELKSGYCFIDNACKKQGSTHGNGEENKCCNPQTNMYAWTDGECDQENSDLEVATVIWIVVGILSVVAIVTTLFIFLKCCKRSNSRRKVGLENETTHVEKIDKSKNVKAACDIQSVDDSLKNSKKIKELAWSGELPDITTTGAAKPAYKRHFWNVHEDVASTEINDEERSTSNDTRVVVPTFGDLSFCSENGNECPTASNFDDEQNTERCLSAVSFKVE